MPLLTRADFKTFTPCLANDHDDCTGFTTISGEVLSMEARRVFMCNCPCHRIAPREAANERWNFLSETNPCR